MSSLAKENRIVKSSDFKAVYQNNQIVVKGQYFIVLTFYCSEASKVGFVASKKVSKKAVVRNKLKRIMRQSARLKGQQISGFKTVVIAKFNAGDVANSKLFIDLDKLWVKLERQCKQYLSS